MSFCTCEFSPDGDLLTPCSRHREWARIYINAAINDSYNAAYTSGLREGVTMGGIGAPPPGQPVPPTRYWVSDRTEEDPSPGGLRSDAPSPGGLRSDAPSSPVGETYRGFS